MSDDKEIAALMMTDVLSPIVVAVVLLALVVDAMALLEFLRNRWR